MGEYNPRTHVTFSLTEDLIYQVNTWITITTTEYTKEGAIYSELLDLMIEATEKWGECFDDDFRKKVIPERDWKRYLELYLGAEDSESRLRYAWRLWQCFQRARPEAEDVLELIKAYLPRLIASVSSD